MTFDAGTPTPEVVADDHLFAAWLAEVAGRRLLEVRGEGLEGKELKDAGDAAAHELLMGLLATYRPDDAVLSEEALESAVDKDARLNAAKVWIIDPLDGTREFSEPPRDDWAVHVALWEGGTLTAGAVAQPELGETFNTGAPPVVPPRTSVKPRIAVSRSRPPAFVQALAEKLDAELVPMGSAGVKMMSVVRDVADAYVHAGGQYEWDSAAPVAVARAAGLFTSRVDGSELVYNQDDVYLPDLDRLPARAGRRHPRLHRRARHRVTSDARCSGRDQTALLLAASLAISAAAAQCGLRIRRRIPGRATTTHSRRHGRVRGRHRRRRPARGRCRRQDHRLRRAADDRRHRRRSHGHGDVHRRVRRLRAPRHLPDFAGEDYPVTDATGTLDGAPSGSFAADVLGGRLTLGDADTTLPAGEHVFGVTYSANAVLEPATDVDQDRSSTLLSSTRTGRSTSPTPR